MFAASCRELQVGSLCSQKGACATRLLARGIAGLRFASPRGLKSKNRFAFLHEIQTIARDRFQIIHVSLEKVDLVSLTREQTLLHVYLLLQLVDFGAALHQLFVRWDEQAHNHEPDREDQQNAKNSVKSLPDGGFATRAKIGVGLIHLAYFIAVLGFVTKFFFDSQELIVFRDAIAAGNRPGLDLAGVRRDRDVGNRCILRFARAMADYGGVIVFFGQINRCQRFGKRADLIHLDQNRIRHVLSNSLPQKFDVRDKEIVTNELNLFTKLRG
jgi:hypothetical protein